MLQLCEKREYFENKGKLKRVICREKLSKDLIIKLVNLQRRILLYLFYRRRWYSLFGAPDSRQVALQAAAHTEGFYFYSFLFFCFLGLAVSQFVKPAKLLARQSFFRLRGRQSILLNLQFRPDLLPAVRWGERERVCDLQLAEFEFKWFLDRVQLSR